MPAVPGSTTPPEAVAADPRRTGALEAEPAEHRQVEGLRGVTTLQTPLLGVRFLAVDVGQLGTCTSRRSPSYACLWKVVLLHGKMARSTDIYRGPPT
jgi:hypothetical protein